jgi:hypothetical protein
MTNMVDHKASQLYKHLSVSAYVLTSGGDRTW